MGLALALLLAYPVAILVLSLVEAPAEDALHALHLELEVRSAGERCPFEVALELSSAAERAYVAREAVLVVTEADAPILTRIEEGSALASRMGSEGLLKPAARARLVYCLDVGRPRAARAVEAGVRFEDPARGESHTLQQRVVLDPGESLAFSESSRGGAELPPPPSAP